MGRGRKAERGGALSACLAPARSHWELWATTYSTQWVLPQASTGLLSIPMSVTHRLQFFPGWWPCTDAQAGGFPSIEGSFHPKIGQLLAARRR